MVSTHSRPKAAGLLAPTTRSPKRFNTQPPEGGCTFEANPVLLSGFNTQPPEGGCPELDIIYQRLKFQHTAARRRLASILIMRPPVHCFNTQPPEGGWSKTTRRKLASSFQHTAARRRLKFELHMVVGIVVSTHSRPKAADIQTAFVLRCVCFNTQPPEGGWQTACRCIACDDVSTHSRPKAAASAYGLALETRQFQHTAARRRLPSTPISMTSQCCFNTQPPEGGWYHCTLR